MAAKARSLRAYRAKRDFDRTPEPPGKPAKRPARKLREKSGPMFCVQKHLATRLHYDFRLEHRGVLLSWAVPKGPSLNLKDKRLAMRTEDHPLEYGNFEGVIPEGYGAGIVMLWDKGSWKPQDENVDAALKKGNLKFDLDGVKLKGSWALVRTSGRGGVEAIEGDARESWLLIKKADFWSGDVDITTLAPKSVTSKRDFADILKKDKPDIWRSIRSGDREHEMAAASRIVQKLLKYQESQQEQVAHAKDTGARRPARRGTKAKRTATSKRPRATRTR